MAVHEVDSLNPGLNISKFVLNKLPELGNYIPDFITEADEATLLKNILSAPKPKWKQLANRRLQNWGGLPHSKGMIPEKLPLWLQQHCFRISCLGVFDGNVPNHVLVNEYLSGQGIMPHLDGSLFWPTIATINLGSHTVLNFYQSEQSDDMLRDENSASQRKILGSILMQPRSLLILRSDLYTKYLHGIDEITSDIITSDIANLHLCSNFEIGQPLERQTRISVTIRYVPKTLKTTLKLHTNKT